MLRIENLNAGYKENPVLNRVNLLLQQGEICCIIGEEGTGKSTLLKAITGQIKTTGFISYNEINLSDVPTSKMTSIGVDFIMQGGNILPRFTVEDHISL